MTDRALRKARLAAARLRWGREDRERGYMNVRPYRPAYKRVRRKEQQFKEALFTLGICIVMVLAVMGQ
jgi:hypothetical protein